MSNPTRFTIKLLALAVAASALHVNAFAQETHADVYVASRPQNLTWGAFPIDKAPVVTIKSGQTVRIDTLSHAGSTQDEPPAEFLAGYGVKRDEILQDVLDFWAARSTLRQPGGGGGHVLTGPIYVEGAEPADTLEVQILSLRTRVPYGMNSTGPTGGVFRESYPGFKEGDAPLDIPEGTRHLIRTGTVDGRDVACVRPGSRVRARPENTAAIWTFERSPWGQACTFRCSIPARDSTSAIRTVRRVTAKSVATRSSSH
jgi:Acetamidase/Formamidase family